MRIDSSFNTGIQIDASIREQTEIIANMIAPIYNPEETYEIGSVVRREDGGLWVCVEKIDEPEEWDARHWQRAVVVARPDDSGDDMPPSDIVWSGYYYADVFWKEAEHLNRLPNRPDRIYVDVPSQALYVYSSSTEEYARLIPVASPTVSGVSKLYSDLGDNADGSVTQQKITEELGRKVEMDVSHLQSDEILGLFIKP